MILGLKIKIETTDTIIEKLFSKTCYNDIWIYVNSNIDILLNEFIRYGKIRQKCIKRKNINIYVYNRQISCDVTLKIHAK